MQSQIRPETAIFRVPTLPFPRSMCGKGKGNKAKGGKTGTRPDSGPKDLEFGYTV